MAALPKISEGPGDAVIPLPSEVPLLQTVGGVRSRRDLRGMQLDFLMANRPAEIHSLGRSLIETYRKRLWRLILFIGLFLPLTASITVDGQTSVAPGKFGWKPSGFENSAVGGSSQGYGEGFGASSESEVEITPQYKTKANTVFAFRGVLNLLAVSNAGGSSSDWRLTFPEVSAFAVGKFGRIEAGDRAGFPQSLIGFTPSEIAFTSAEFGPDSGQRLDPSGGLPTLFLPHSLADRINALTYLGYAARFYDDRSLKLIYLTPRSRSGFYGAVSYTPSTDISSGFTLAGDTNTRNTGLQDVGNSEVFRNIVQVAGVWTHRTQDVEVSTGSTYSYATGSAINPLVQTSNSLSAGISMTLHDAWTFGLSETYDGFSTIHKSAATSPSPVSPYGIVASANYVDGPWAYGGYYQHATSNSLTPEPGRDTVNISEAGISRLVDPNHDLLGSGFYTDVRLFAAVYYYRFHGSEPSSVAASENGGVFLVGARFSFF